MQSGKSRTLIQNLKDEETKRTTVVLDRNEREFITSLIKEGKESGYGYEFDDDPLAAGGFGPNDATIRVRPGPVRTTLIRPRISFVDNMLKSVENL